MGGATRRARLGLEILATDFSNLWTTVLVVVRFPFHAIPAQGADPPCYQYQRPERGWSSYSMYPPGTTTPDFADAGPSTPDGCETGTVVQPDPMRTVMTAISPAKRSLLIT